MTDWEKRAKEAEAEIGRAKGRSAIESELRRLGVPASSLSDFADLALTIATGEGVTFDGDGQPDHAKRYVDIGGIAREFVSSRRDLIAHATSLEGKAPKSGGAKTAGGKPSTRLLEENDDNMDVEKLLNMGIANQKAAEREGR